MKYSVTIHFIELDQIHFLRMLKDQNLHGGILINVRLFMLRKFKLVGKIKNHKIRQISMYACPSPCSGSEDDTIFGLDLLLTMSHFVIFLENPPPPPRQVTNFLNGP